VVILGIDPGISSTGYGIIRAENGQPVWEGWGVIGQGAAMPSPQRLNRIFEGVCSVIEQYRPDHMAIEDIFYSKNVRSTLIIGQARGVAILASVRAGISISEYAPRAVKQAVVGSGAASKEQVQFMVKRLLNLQDREIEADAADALAIAICHANRIQIEELSRQSATAPRSRGKDRGCSPG
jgi:crossover junction endodeoxyribonuclease RuvC